MTTTEGTCRCRTIGTSGESFSVFLDCAVHGTFSLNVFAQHHRTDVKEAKIVAVASLLQDRYKDFAHYNRKNPFEELLFILCSVQTQESNYRRTFRALQRRFPRMNLLAGATAGEIAEPLRSGGLYRHKSRRINQICVRLIGAFGRATLAPLRALTDKDCETFLTSLPGVGLKVARCVMLYSFDRAVFPVDTHCWRICQRLGWVRAVSKNGKCTRADMERLQQAIPPRWRFSLHVNLISLGRDLCTANNPKCKTCPLAQLCRRGRRQSDSEENQPVRTNRNRRQAAPNRSSCI